MTCKLEKKISMIVNTKNNTYKMTYKKLGKRNECTVNIENISMNQIGLIYLSGRYF